MSREKRVGPPVTGLNVTAFHPSGLRGLSRHLPGRMSREGGLAPLPTGLLYLLPFLLVLQWAQAPSASAGEPGTVEKVVNVVSPKGVPIAGLEVYGRLDDELKSDVTDDNGRAVLLWSEDTSSVPEQPEHPEDHETRTSSWGALKSQYAQEQPPFPRVASGLVQTPGREAPDIPNNTLMIYGAPEYWSWKKDFGSDMGQSDTTNVMITPYAFGGVPDWDVGLMKSIYGVGNGPYQYADNLTWPGGVDKYPLRVYTAFGELTQQEREWVFTAIDDINTQTSQLIPQGALVWNEGGEYDVGIIPNSPNNSATFSWDSETFEINNVFLRYRSGYSGIGNPNICRKELYRAVTGCPGNSADPRLGVLYTSSRPWTVYDLVVLEWSLDDKAREIQGTNQTLAREFFE